MERAKGFESIRDHRPVSSETGVISHKSTCNTRFAFCPARSKTTFLRRGFVIRSHANSETKSPWPSLTAARIPGSPLTSILPAQIEAKQSFFASQVELFAREDWRRPAGIPQLRNLPCAGLIC